MKPIGSVQTDHRQGRDASLNHVRPEEGWPGQAHSRVGWAVFPRTLRFREHLSAFYVLRLRVPRALIETGGSP